MSLTPREALPRSRDPHSSFPSHQSPLSITQDKGSHLPHHFSCLPLSLLPLPPSAEKKRICTCLCNRYHLGCQGTCTLLFNLGSALIHSLNQQLFTKHLVGDRHNHPVGPPHLFTLPSVHICATGTASFQSSLASLPGNCNSFRTGLSTSGLAPSNPAH